MKKLLLLMLGVLIALPSFAVDFTYTYKGQTLTYTIISETDRTVRTRSGTTYGAGNKVSGDLIIPETVIYQGMLYTVTQLGEYSFSNCPELTSVTIPNTVTSIGQEAFYSCTGLSSINLPKGLTSISSFTFYVCKNLTSIDIPEGVTSIGRNAFTGCNSLMSIKLPESLTSIDQFAISHCTSLTSITLPQSLTNIGGSAFYYCKGLTSIDFPESVTTIGSQVFYGCDNLTECTIYIGPKTTIGWGNNNVYFTVYITSNPLEVDKALASIPNIKSIHLCAPSDYKQVLDSDWQYKQYIVKEPFVCDGVHYAWNDDDSNTLKIVGFDDDLKTVTFNETVYDLPITAFDFSWTDYPAISHIIYNRADVPANFCKDMAALKVLELGENVATIGDNAFAGAVNLKALDLKENVASIGNNAFAGVNFDVVTISAAVPPVLGENVFAISDPKMQLYFADSLAYAYKSNGQWSEYFDLLSADGGVAPNGWTYEIISDLNDISNLQVRLTAIPADMKNSLIIPATIEVNGHVAQVVELDLDPSTLGSFATFTIENSPLPLKQVADITTQIKCSTLYVGRDIVVDADYDAPVFGYNYIRTVTFGPDVTKITRKMFMGSMRIGTIDLSETKVDSIGELAFKGVTGMVNLTLPATLKYIGKQAFVGTTISKLDFGTVVEEIDDNAFAACNRLNSVKFNSPLRRIGSEAFARCTKLTAVEFTDTIGVIEPQAFAELSLASLDVNAATIKADAFAYVKVTGKAPVKISAPVIEPQAFKNLQATAVDSLFVNTQSSVTNIFAGAEMPALKALDITAAVIDANPLTSANIDPTKLDYFHITADEVKDSAFENLTLADNADIEININKIGEYAFGSLRAENMSRFVINSGTISSCAFFGAYLSSDNPIYITADRINREAFIYFQSSNNSLCAYIEAREFGMYAFVYATGLKKIYVSGGSLPSSAFMGCDFIQYAKFDCQKIGGNVFGVYNSPSESLDFTSLTTIDIFENVKEISAQAFMNNGKLSEVNFHNCQLQSVGTNAFSGCPISRFVFPTIEGAEPTCIISEWALGDKIKYLDLGNTVKEIGDQNFSRNIDVEYINLGKAEVVGGFTNYPDSLFVPASVVSFNTNSLISYKKMTGLKHIVFEPSDNPVNMTRLGSEIVTAEINREVIFQEPWDGTIERVTYPDTDEHKFNAYICAADTVYLGSGVATATFTTDCAPASFAMADGVQGIVVSDGATLTLPIEDLHIPASMTRMAGNITLPADFKLNIADAPAEPALDLKDLVINTADGRKPEVYCGRNITLEARPLGRLTSWSNVIFGDSVTAVAEHCFDGSTGLETAVLSPSITSIGNSAFKDCTSLTTVEFSENLETIEAAAYDGCTGVEKVVARGTVPAEGEFAFDLDMAEVTPLYVPDESITKYANSENFFWFDMFDNIHPLSEGNLTEEIEIGGGSENIDPGFNAGCQYHFPSLFEIIIRIYKGLTGQHAPARVAAKAPAAEGPSVSDLLWVSSDTRVASVDHDGNVTFHTEDPVKITAYVTDGSGKHLTFEINNEEKYALGDLNLDGIINSGDLNLMINGIKEPETTPLTIKVADMNGDGVINTLDLNLIITKLMNN